MMNKKIVLIMCAMLIAFALVITSCTKTQENNNDADNAEVTEISENGGENTAGESFEEQICDWIFLNTESGTLTVRIPLNDGEYWESETQGFEDDFDGEAELITSSDMENNEYAASFRGIKDGTALIRLSLYDYMGVSQEVRVIHVNIADGKITDVEFYDEYAGVAEKNNKLIGSWQDRTSQRAVMAVYGNIDFTKLRVTIHWGSSASESAEWTMTAEYDAERDAFYYEDGEYALVTYLETGEIGEKSVEWSGSSGYFTVSEENNVTWYDSKQENSGEFDFERIYAPEVTAEEFGDKYFSAVAASEQGTAGASMKNALAACELISFADASQVWNMDETVLRDNFYAAYMSLDDDIKSRFDENYEAVFETAAEISADPDGMADILSDIGADMDTVRRLSARDDVKASIRTLKFYTDGIMGAEQ